MTARRTHLVLLALALGVVGCDHATKGVAERELSGGPPVPLVAGVVDLQYAQNHGVAFNTERVLPATWRKVVVFTGGFVALGFVCLLWLRRRNNPSLEHLGYALIVGGAVGNLTDRAFRGYVVDFVHIRGWPIFNVADVALVIGVAVLAVHAWRTRDTPPLGVS